MRRRFSLFGFVLSLRTRYTGYIYGRDLNIVSAEEGQVTVACLYIP